MPDRFDDAKRALEDVPAHEVWAEVERRAADGTVVPLAPVPARAPRRRGRWLAAAAALVLAAGTVAVLVRDDEDPVDTVPGGSGPAAETEITTYQAPGACKVGITGAPLPEPTRVSAVVITEEAHATRIDGDLGPGQLFAVQVPGEVVTDLVGERVEEVQIRRGTAALWFQGEQVAARDGRLARNPVQLRWFTGSQEPCESFTVTVDGGTEDENRHAAVDLGERVLMSTELPECCEADPARADDPLDGTGWQLERATVDGEPTGGSGARFSFAGGRVTWSDLCNTFEGGYEVAEDLLVVDPTTDVTGSGVSCAANPTTDAIGALMSARRIAWAIDDRGFLTLTALGVELVLGTPAGEDEPGGPSNEDSEPYGIWPMTAPEAVLGYAPEVTGTAQDVALAFAERVLEWPDAVVAATEPREDESDGSVFLVTSETRGGEVELRVRAGDGPDRHVVYSVNTPARLADPEAGLGVSVRGSVARADVSPIPAGTTATVRFTYGEYAAEGPVGDDIELTGDQTVPGAVLILFRDPEGRVVGAVGTALPAGDFAAS
jgi:hypothetical protein